MLPLGQPKNETRISPFIVVSVLLHLLLLLVNPRWEASRIPGVTPGEGTLTFTLRTPEHASPFSLQRVTPTNVVPQPQVRPTPVQAVETPSQQVQVAQRPQTSQPQPVAQVPVQSPQVNPAPPQPDTSRAPVQVVQAATPQPEPRPLPASVTPEPERTVVTVESSTVPVATEGENGSASTSGSGTGLESSDVDGVGESVAPPAPSPPPPPAVGSVLRFPGGSFLPKNYEHSWGTVSVRVHVLVDETGNIVDARVDPAMSAPNDAINQWAVSFARALVQTEPGPEGQAYEASFVITFDPQAPVQEGVQFSTDPNERIRLLNSD